MPGASGAAARLRTRSPDETEALGAELGSAAFPGAVLLIEGPLGAGKTTLVRGLGRGLEARGPVTSPTFTMLAVHEGRLPLFHVDLYRIEAPAELRAIDLDEVLGAGGVTAVEWPRWLLRAMPQGTLEVRLSVLDPAEREVTLVPHDPRWEAALGGLGNVADREGRRERPGRAGAATGGGGADSGAER